LEKVVFGDMRGLLACSE